VGTERRGRFSDAERVRIVEESLAGQGLVSATARRHGVSRSLLTRWRRLYRKGCLDRQGRLKPGEAGSPPAPCFAPVVVSESEAVAAPMAAGGVGDRIEIVLANGRRIIVGVWLDASALARVIGAVERA